MSNEVKLGELRMWDGVEDADALSKEGVEVWAEAVGGRGVYFISNLGRFVSLARGVPTLLRGSQSSTGYILYSLLFDDYKKSFVANKMVLLAFRGPPPTPEHTDAGHGKDGSYDKTDNRLCNLVWQTRSENMKEVATARKRDGASSSTAATPIPNATYSLKAEQVQHGIRLFQAGRLRLSDVAEMWGVSTDVARRALVGETWAELSRDREAIEAHLGRSGEKNHKVTVTDASLAAAFALYVEPRWSGVQFAQHLNIAQPTAHSILSGRTRTNVPRPDGFLYPWPDARSMNARSGEEHPATSLTRESILEVFGRVERGEFKGVKEVGEALGLSRSAAYALVEGRSWADLPRSAEFHAAVSRMRRTVLSTEDQKAAIQALVEGEDRQAVVERYNLSPSKLQAYITKANKLRSAPSA
jgi:hypothetical protein